MRLTGFVYVRAAHQNRTLGLSLLPGGHRVDGGGCGAEGAGRWPRLWDERAKETAPEGPHRRRRWRAGGGTPGPRGTACPPGARAPPGRGERAPPGYPLAAEGGGCGPHATPMGGLLLCVCTRLGTLKWVIPRWDISGGPRERGTTTQMWDSTLGAHTPPLLSAPEPPPRVSRTSEVGARGRDVGVDVGEPERLHGGAKAPGGPCGGRRAS